MTIKDFIKEPIIWLLIAFIETYIVIGAIVAFIFCALFFVCDDLIQWGKGFIGCDDD